MDREKLIKAFRNDQIPQSSNSNSDNNFQPSYSEPNTRKLSLFFASLCVIDLFGVFPIIALPRVIILCGLYGVPLIVFVITLQIYTAVVLGRCWVIAERLKPEIIEQSRYPYAVIAKMTYGSKVSLLVTILLDLSVFGGGVPNLLVASQNLQLLGSIISHGSFDFSFCFWLIIIGCSLCPLMWLGSPKNMTKLSSLSVSICSSVAFLIWLNIVSDTNKGNDVNDSLGTNSTESEDFSSYEPFAGMSLTPPAFLNLLKAYGVIAFQFDIHPLLLTIQVDMQDKRQIGLAAGYGILVSCILSSITTVLAAYRYGTYITQNILEVLPRSWGLNFILLLVTFQLCLSSVIGNSALFQHIEEFFGASREFSWKRCVIRSSLVVLAVFIGEALPRFDVVMSLIGGTLTGPLIFILPPLFYTKTLSMQKKFNATKEENNTQMRNMSQNKDQAMKNNGNYGTISYQSLNEVTVQTPCKTVWDTANVIFFVLKSDCVLSSAVIVFGLAATFTSTYFNIIDGLDNFKDLWPPCILNISQTTSI